MRVTKTKLEKEEVKQIKNLVDEVVTTKDFTMSVDFACDAYALFKEELSKRSVIKGYWQLFGDVRELYSFYRIGSLMDSFDFYLRIKNFFKFFMFSQLFRELDKLDALEATEYFLKMFQPPQEESKPKPKPQPAPPEPQEEEQDEEEQEEDKPETHESPSGQEDQKGLSANEDNLPIDMNQFKQQMPNIEKVLDSGMMDKDDLQEFIGKHAGISTEEIHIGNISEIVKKLSSKISQKELDIFYVARKKELTDKYRRDEVLESVQLPDNEMSVKEMSEHQEVLKVLPSQFALDDDVFTEKLAKKELQVRDYQSRKLKKQALYMLLDVSGSMADGSDIYASGVALSLVRQAIEEGSIYFLRFFDGSAHQMYRISNQKEAIKMCDILAKKPYSGGGTNIQNAIKTAVDDIKKDPVEFEKVEIMIITDGEDHVGMDKKDLDGIKLHTTIINGNNSGLEAISDSYTKLNSSEI